MGKFLTQKTERAGALPGLEERRQIVARADSVLAEARALVHRLDQMEGHVPLSGQNLLPWQGPPSAPLSGRRLYTAPGH